ncbi:MAG: helix-hairpin-helix domain-containing protein, partial [Dokdonella sp.]
TAEEGMDEHQPSADLLGVEGMEDALAYELAQHRIVSRQDLADLSTDEFMELGLEGIDEDQASNLIMAAREAVAS